MTWGAVAGAAVGVVGSVISSNGAKSAAGAQSQSSEQAQMMQAMAQAQLRQDLSPWTQAGGAAQSRLNQLLGIGGVGSGGVTSMGLQTGLTPDKVREQLLSRYTKQATGANSAPAYANGNEAINALGGAGAAQYFQDRLNTGNTSALYTSPNMTKPGQDGQPIVAGGADQYGPGSTIDEEGLNAAIAKYYEEQNAQNAALEADPTYGSLMRAYRNGEEFSFDGKDLASDPGYQFGLNQGTQGIERGQASRGNFLSGAAMKELDRFNQDYAGTKFNDAFNRNLSTWNTNLGAYNQHQNSLYDMLTGVSRTGQNSAAQVGTSNIAGANAIGNNMIGAGNAQAAGTVAGTNSLVNGINQAANAYNTGTNSAAGWNSLISSGATPYGASQTSVSAGATWAPSTNVFGSSNGRLF